MNVKNVKKFIKDNIYLFFLFAFVALNFFIATRLNIFRYNNFDFGKFDLGNMSQMAWYTLRGKVMYLTDYFGSNVPRWSLSHVDPLLLFFVPIFAVIPHPLTLPLAQLLLVVLSAFVVYGIANLELKSKLAACAISFAYLLYPAMGFINGTMGFHAVTAAIPFFLGAFYVFEKMYKENRFTTKGIVVFWILLILTMAGKEQVPLYIFMWGLFVLIFRTIGAEKFEFKKEWFSKYLKLKTTKIGLSMAVVGLLWFVTAFFIIIPKYAPLRVQSYERFLTSIDMDVESGRDVTLPNYFLSRYGDFGGSYKDVILNMLINPNKLIRVFFSGDRLDSLDRTFKPVLYMPFANPAMLLISAPDFLINYLVTDEGLGVEDIETHRISMIIPVLFVSTIYAISFISKLLGELVPKFKKYKKHIVVLASVAVLFSCLRTSSVYNNPMYLWFSQAVKRRVSASYDKEGKDISDVKTGDVVKLSDLDLKDVKCANAIIDLIPDDATVSGPDNLGDHLSLRETYAIFPALWNEADYVIVDVQSRKLLAILNLSTNIISDLTESLITSEKYDLVTACGNLYLFKRGEPREKTNLLPIQERYQYREKYQFDILNLIRVVDFNIPSKVYLDKPSKATLVYKRIGEESLDGYLLYMTYVNKETEKVFQVANLASFAITRPSELSDDIYYIEDIDIAPPSYVEPGEYQVFLSLSNKIKIRSLYLTDLVIE